MFYFSDQHLPKFLVFLANALETEKLTPDTLKTILTQTTDDGWNALMFAARYQSQHLTKCLAFLVNLLLEVDTLKKTDRETILTEIRKYGTSDILKKVYQERLRRGETAFKAINELSMKLLGKRQFAYLMLTLSRPEQVNEGYDTLLKNTQSILTKEHKAKCWEFLYKFYLYRLRRTIQQTPQTAFSESTYKNSALLQRVSTDTKSAGSEKQNMIAKKGDSYTPIANTVVAK